MNPFSLKHLVAFGTQCTCYIPPPRRSGKKQPGQVKSMEGVILGYVDDMNAYKVWDLKEKKVREVSFYFTVVSEGFFPFKNKKNWPEEEEKEPTSFFPTFETFLRGEEWKLFRFSPEEEKDALRHQGILEVPPVRSHTHPPSHTRPLAEKKPPEQGKRDGGGGGGVSVSERKEEKVSERKEEKPTRFLDIRAPASVRQAPRFGEREREKHPSSKERGGEQKEGEGERKEERVFLL